MWEELLKMLALVDESKKEEAKKFAEAAMGKITSLDGEVTKHEAAKLDAIGTRDKIKSKLKDIGSKLGIDIDADNVDDAIAAIKAKKGVDKTEALTIAETEIANLKKEVEDMSLGFDAERNQLKSQVLGVALEKDVAVLLPKYKAKTNATPYLMDAIKKQAVFEDGKIIFKNEDGTTRRIGGKDATLDGIIAEMQAKEKESNESMFFDISVQDSGADKRQGGTRTTGGDFVP